MKGFLGLVCFGFMAHQSFMPIHFYKYHHHHHIALVAQISLTLSRHSSLSFIALGRSSGQHPVSSHSCWMYVRAGRPAFARPCVGIHKSTSLMSSSLLLQQSIQFRVSTQFSSIWSIDRVLSGATNPGQSEPWTDGNKGYSAFSKAPALLETIHQIA